MRKIIQQKTVFSRRYPSYIWLDDLNKGIEYYTSSEYVIASLNSPLIQRFSLKYSDAHFGYEIKKDELKNICTIVVYKKNYSFKHATH